MKNKGREFEKKFIKTINSGAFFRDADAVSDTHTLEIKFTEKKGFRISTKLLQKIWDEALNRNRLPMIGIGIYDKENDETWMLKVDITKKGGRG